MLPLIYFQLRVYCNALLCTTNTMSRSSGTLRRHFEDGKYVVFGQCLLDQYVKYFFMILKHLCTYVAVLNFP